MEKFNASDIEVRLFLSIDICGSTNLKYNNSEPNYSADRPIIEFISDFKFWFIEAINKFCKVYETKLDIWQPWKFLGDEIIFQGVVKNATQCGLYTLAFYTALLEYNERSWIKDQIRVKGTAWLAQIPFRNRKIELADSSNKNRSFDLIGLDMDIGFRLGKFTRPGQCIVSLDLAEVLTYIPARMLSIRFHHVGWEILKGAFGEKPYPIIWISGKILPKLLPWETHYCEFTKKFVFEKPLNCLDVLRLAKDVRDSLPSLNLFPVYFTVENMPHQHKEALEMWEQEFIRQNDHDIKTIYLGDDPPPDIPFP